MEKKKVLFVISRLTLGGAQKSLINAVNYFDFDKYDVYLYIRENKTTIIGNIDSRVKIIVNEHEKRYDYYPTALFFELLKKLKIKDFSRKATDYVVKKKENNERKHYFGQDIEYDIAISYINGYTCKFVADVVNAKKKVLFYLGSSDPSPKLHKKYLPQFDAIVSDSKGTAKFLMADYPELKDKIRVIENFVDYREITEKSEQTAIENTAKTVICSCGRMVHVKGFDLAVEAAKILKDKNIDFNWVFVGDGPERSKIEEKIKMYGLDEIVTLVGAQTNPYPYIRSCDIYVQPSYEESFGLTITEAMMLCRVVVSTDTVGGREQITDGENGILTLVSPKGIADGIAGLICDKEKYSCIYENLKKKDYSADLVEFKRKWQNLLEAI